ncbi:MAG: fructosamine kinase family protein [Myxococcales bacterium]|nr:fructosamine kinase family protein [Myxococcales bacterium]
MSATPEQIASALGASLARATRVAGGDVAIAYCLDLSDGRRVFAKTHANPAPLAFSTEAAGLSWLRDSATLALPEVLEVSDDPPFLVLEWIERGRPDSRTEAALGRALARLHATGAPSFGREDRRSTGSRGLPNEPCGSWAEFYATQRLLPLARLAADGKALSARSLRELHEIAARLADLGGPVEPPARLHGDLWGGNRLVGTDGENWLIDPAAHGGHREFDLAMMRLFGGFGDACFAAYAELTPLAEGWRERVALHQLAPLVVHAIKFGGGYVEAVDGALSGYR